MKKPVFIFSCCFILRFHFSIFFSLKTNISQKQTPVTVAIPGG